MERLTYSDILDRLDGFDSWLTRLGITPRPNDRIHEAFKVLRRADEASRRGRQTGTYEEIRPGDWFPIIEALEAHDIFAAFHSDQSPMIPETLRRALSGPALPINEHPRNRDGRNIWFELALAAEWRLRGASVGLGEPDLRLTTSGRTFLIACKRPANEGSVQANITEAMKQLRHNLEEAPNDHFGVAAISLSCTLNAGNQVFTGKIDDLRSYLEYELKKHEDLLSRVVDPRICCVIFHVATPGVAGEEVDLVRASFTVAQELTPSVGSTSFEEHALAMRDTPKQFGENSGNLERR